MSNDVSLDINQESNPVQTVAPPKEDNNMLRATDKITALYCRLSVEDTKEKDGKDDPSNSIQHQQVMLMEYAKSQHFPNPTFFIDDGYSGVDFSNRPGFQKMLAEIEAGHVEVVITKDLSRLGRNSSLTGLYITYTFPQYGVRYIAINDHFDTIDPNSTDSDMAGIKNWFNEWYSKDTSRKIRAVNKDGHSDWSTFSVKTKSNPLEFAIKGIRGEVTAEEQEGFEIFRLFDFAELGDMFHTKYRKNAMPFDMIIDLRTINQLDKFHYLSRQDGGNGTILAGNVAYSMDKENWTAVDSFRWERNGDVKIFTFKNQPKARYIKLHITEGVGNYASGRELYVFKVPGTESYLPGDINNDKKIDANDLTSYMNYTGLRRGDSDFDYVSAGDINQNGLIDAYDISVVTTQLEDGIENPGTDRVAGTLSLSTPKQTYNAGETVEITVKGDSIKAVNALSFALPYDQQDYDFAGIEPANLGAMENLTYDRLHTSGQKALYPTFVNLGDKKALEGSEDLFTIKLKAKRKVKFNLKAVDGILVDKNLNMQKF